MTFMQKTTSFIFCCLLAFTAGIGLFPHPVFAEDVTVEQGVATDTQEVVEESAPGSEVSEARVIQVMEEREITQADGSHSTQQNLKLKGLTGSLKDREFEFHGIGEIDAVSASTYHVGDRVVVNRQVAPDGAEEFYVVDYVRRWPLFWLAALFILSVIVITAGKGFRSLIGLVISFAGIMGIAVPLIFRGWDPLWVGAATAAAIFVILVYLTEGFNHKSNLSAVSAFICLLLTAGLATVFTQWARLTGMAQEETMFLIGVGTKSINFSGLYLAGILIGTLGVLDDVILAQIEAVIQIREANPALPPGRVAAMAMRIGKTHIGAMVNTLFLAYAGASLPLLLLFSVKQPPFMTFSQVVNNEVVASEIVRTLVGSIGLVLAMPIATYLAAYRLKPTNKGSVLDAHRHG
ncbi:YibE/F family protein [Candidatus Uhrbacteria bacterium]|nr:YibE/F family protein [Candidatus Uhrbacteria bacterium]